MNCLKCNRSAAKGVSLNPPRKLVLSESGLGSVTVSWLPPADDIEDWHYVVRCKEARNTFIPDLTTETSENQLTLRHLYRINVPYIIEVYTKYEDCISKPSSLKFKIKDQMVPQPEGLTLDVFASNVLTVSWLSPSNSGVSYDYVVSCLEVGEDDATVASELTTNLHHTFTNNIALDRKYIVKVSTVYDKKHSEPTILQM